LCPPAVVSAGAAEKIISLVLTVPVTVQSEMTACAAVLGLSGALFPFLFRGVFGFVLLRGAS
jgi:vacuolar protein 8